MKIRLILQVRTTSVRLPGKALLDFFGFPAVILAALRASNQGHNLIVATSDDVTDDALVEVLKKNNLNYFRGDLNDVLKRYISATEDLDDHDLIVRLTADTLFPDGLFISKLLDEYKRVSADYLTTASEESKLPYGLSVEIFTVEMLRKADRFALTPYEREHVTPYISKISKNKKIFEPKGEFFLSHNLGNYRCTLDTFNDYMDLQKLFSDVQNPVEISYKDLCEKLLVTKKIGLKKTHECYLTLGTAQLGLAYGIANKKGLVSEESAINIIQKAISQGIFSFDTARSYGLSEKRIGKALTTKFKGLSRVITKLKLKVDVSSFPEQEQINNMVDASVFRSCVEMDTKILDTLLLHDISHLKIWEGLIWKRLIELKNLGYIKKLGVSVYHPESAIDVLQDENIEHIQLPFNILDHRWYRYNFPEILKKRKKIEIFVRSVLLQGLLILPYDEWPPVISSEYAKKLSDTLHGYVKEFNRTSIIDLSLAYVRALPWVDSIIIGVDSAEQLTENINLFENNQPLNKNQIELIQSKFNNVPEVLLNPINWSRL